MGSSGPASDQSPRDGGRDTAGRVCLSQEGIARRASEPAESAFVHTASSQLLPTRHGLTATLAICVDLAAAGLGFCLPALLRFSPESLAAVALTQRGTALIGLGAILWVAILTAHGTYRPRTLLSRSEQLLRVGSAALLAWILTQLLAFLLKEATPLESRLVVALSLPSALLLVFLGRLCLVRPVAGRFYRRLQAGPVLIIGDTIRSGRLARRLEETAARSREVVSRPLATMTTDEAVGLVEEYSVGEVFIEPHGRSLDDVLDIAFACLDASAEVSIISGQFQVLIGRSAIGDYDGIPVVRLRRIDFSGPEAVLKRVLDLMGGAIGLVALSPLLLWIAVAVKVGSPGPILFRQQRIGRRGQPFKMYKFRTMDDGNDQRIHENYLRAFIRDGVPATVGVDGTKIYKLTGDPRVTRVGAWLRSLSLDELPQLWNVIRGEMSLVGPRPCLPYEWNIYKPWQRRRLDVPPGCTGLWQVTGRSLVSFEEMVILDLYYAHHGSIAADLGLMLHTIPAMLRGRGGY